jgi:hypothetical protein
MPTRTKRIASFTLFLTVIIATPCLCFCQSTSKLNRDPLDSGIVSPPTTAVLGQRDQTASTELANHLAVVGGQQWAGMQGTGTIIYGALDPTSYAATLSNMGSDSFRLDAQTKTGSTSIRIRRQLGGVQGSDGKVSFFRPGTAMIGLFPFELTRTVPIAATTTSLIDDGLVSIGGAELHRITMAYPSHFQQTGGKPCQVVAIDFYFDPTSHLLIKSSASVAVNEAPFVRFLMVVTYGDYRKVGTSMIPFRYNETMDGQQYRQLQLSTVQLNPALTSAYFEF